jgi:hypothetical protein
MPRKPRSAGLRVPVLGSSRKVLIQPKDERYQRAVEGLANEEDVCLVKVGRTYHLFVYSQSEVGALADIG